MAKKKSLFDTEPERAAVRVVAHCAHDLCDHPAICSIYLKTGRANMCRFHYDQHFKIQADRNNHANGLHTVEQMRSYCRYALGKRRAPGTWWKAEALSKIAAGESRGLAAYEMATASVQRVADRIPGSDDE